MDVAFKNMSNKTISIQVDPNDKLESVVPKLLEQNEIDPEKNTIKFIFKGRVLNNSSSFQEFKDEQKLTIIYMVSKNKSESTKEQGKTCASFNTEVKIEPVQETSTNIIKENLHQEFTTGENANEVDRLRASVIATLFFIRQSPQFSELFMNNFTTLLDVLSSDQLRPLFERIYNDTSEISDSEYIDDMTDHVSDVSSQSNDNFTDQDQHNIDTLVSLGFPKNASIQAYLLCNKNVELAASMLMDN